ncbi:hypothetical protein PRIPAC_90754 [Pristionchus pacificus]|uniref:Uncharacterized protein n=1 Tax=Pristionchus pacificus TaxID=54126 RepID=A0A2A6B8V8_PRIPA|nr:hypothetical protein PRIPAC_90754 [Pristionchus pacificus]|eukprot:PDM62293.1 hypothetical protein PRIPAC_51735 [Pristionchus pacificus]
MMTIDERWEARGSAGALDMVGIYSEIMDGCEGLGPAQWILAYERGEGSRRVLAKVKQQMSDDFANVWRKYECPQPRWPVGLKTRIVEGQIMMTIDERWEARGSAGALDMVGIYSEIMDGCEGLGPAQWILAYERGEVRMAL